MESPALKEWAVTVQALAAGEQQITLRKGGIREEGKHFAVAHGRFFLYPTFDHQRLDLVRPTYRDRLPETLQRARWATPTPGTDAFDRDGGIAQPSEVRIDTWAEVVSVFEVTESAALAALAPFHVWSDDYAEERLRWKPKHPLKVLVLRVRRLPEPAMLPVGAEYGGCKSWVGLDCDLGFEGSPVVGDAEFDDAAERIAKICAAPGPTVNAAATALGH